jgi:hypothetical protein
MMQGSQAKDGSDDDDGDLGADIDDEMDGFEEVEILVD